MWDDDEDESWDSPSNSTPTLVQTGRSPAGRLRNFGAMNDEKLLPVTKDIMREDNDPEALEKLADIWYDRGDTMLSDALTSLARAARRLSPEWRALAR